MNKKILQYSYSLRKERTKKILVILLFVISLVAFVSLIITFLIFPVRQVSESMVPDIAVDSLVLATPIKTNFERGDVILLKPNMLENPTKFKKGVDFLCKFFTAQQISMLEKSDKPGTKQKFRRVIGIPGDTIYMRDYVMYIKPAGEKHFLTEFEIIGKSYNVTFMSVPSTWDSELGVRGYFDEIVLGDDEYFVLGDNRKACDDSRLWGKITPDNISAKALVCYFPFDKVKLF